MQEIDSERFRTVLGHMPTSVAIVTGNSALGPTGSVVSTVSSVSLDPPLISFCVRQPSTAESSVGAMVGVNILAVDQREAYETVLHQSSERLGAEVRWTVSESGLPLVTDSLAWMECRINSVYPIGDHELVIADVDSLTLLRDADPMLSSVADVRSSFWGTGSRDARG